MAFIINWIDCKTFSNYEKEPESFYDRYHFILQKAPFNFNDVHKLRGDPKNSMKAES